LLIEIFISGPLPFEPVGVDTAMGNELQSRDFYQAFNCELTVPLSDAC
jgi:hypothetical protein